MSFDFEAGYPQRRQALQKSEKLRCHIKAYHGGAARGGTGYYYYTRLPPMGAITDDATRWQGRRYILPLRRSERHAPSIYHNKVRRLPLIASAMIAIFSAWMKRRAKGKRWPSRASAKDEKDKNGTGPGHRHLIFDAKM